MPSLLLSSASCAATVQGAIAVALIHQPHQLLLNEPTLGLDVEVTQHIKALVRAIASPVSVIPSHIFFVTTGFKPISKETGDSEAIALFL